jgi:hypothetical protein
MNPLRRLENVIAGLVEGTFGRVFRSEVRPMELAHKLAREMDEHATASVSRTYAPNEYSIWLSPHDRARYEGVEEEIVEELCAYLLEHARREELALASAPKIAFHTDDNLRLGEFGIQARIARAAEAGDRDARHAPPSSGLARPRPARPAARRGVDMGPAGLPAAVPERDELPAAGEQAEEEGGHTMIYSNAARVREAVDQARPARRAKALLVVSGRHVIVPPGGALMGRSRECDVVLDDGSVSRRHAELRPQGDRWVLHDLDSTNGVRINGRTVHAPQALHSGDRVQLGSAEIVFELA